MKIFNAQFLAKLNQLYGAGVFVHAAVITFADHSDYWVDYAEPLLFEGHLYQPLPMRWEGLETSSTMQLPGVRVSVSNIHGQAEDYINDNDLLGRDVRLQMLHRDLLGVPDSVDEILLQVQSIEVTIDTVSLTCGLNLGLTDLFPRFIVTQQEFPGNSDAVRRLSVL